MNTRRHALSEQKMKMTEMRNANLIEDRGQMTKVETDLKQVHGGGEVDSVVAQRLLH